MDASASKDESKPERRVWVVPSLTRHASLAALTQVQQQPFVRGDSLILGDTGVPCSQGFCP